MCTGINLRLCESPSKKQFVILSGGQWRRRMTAFLKETSQRLQLVPHAKFTGLRGAIEGGSYNADITDRYPFLASDSTGILFTVKYLPKPDHRL
jgi:hypothetical protein